MKNQKLSVIIPTVQKNLRVLYQSLGILQNDDVVSEIFIINNFDKELCVPPHLKKVRIYHPEENLYVNKSWNIGIENIENERFLILNDDIVGCEYFCSKVLETNILEDEKTGLVGLSGTYINQYSNKTVKLKTPVINEQDIVSFIPLTRYLHTGDWGSAFFGKKSSYYEIPEDIKIIYGDNYLLYQNQINNKINYEIKGLPFNHIHSLSSASKEFSPIVCLDIANSKKYFK